MRCIPFACIWSACGTCKKIPPLSPRRRSLPPGTTASKKKSRSHLVQGGLQQNVCRVHGSSVPTVSCRGRWVAIDHHDNEEGQEEGADIPPQPSTAAPQPASIAHVGPPQKPRSWQRLRVPELCCAARDAHVRTCARGACLCTAPAGNLWAHLCVFSLRGRKGTDP